MIDELLELSKGLFDKLDRASYARVNVDLQIALERASWEVLRMMTDLKETHERYGE